jgi:hypothetical protein
MSSQDPDPESIRKGETPPPPGWTEEITEVDRAPWSSSHPAYSGNELNVRTTGISHLGAVIYSAGTLLCVLEIVPGLPRPFYYAIMVACGAVAGSLEFPLRWAGAVSGAVAGVGSLLAISTLLARTGGVPKWIALVVILAGMLPGAGLYCVLADLVRMKKGISLSKEERDRRVRLGIIIAVLAAVGGTFVVLIVGVFD